MYVIDVFTLFYMGILPRLDLPGNTNCVWQRHTAAFTWT